MGAAKGAASSHGAAHRCKERRRSLLHEPRHPLPPRHRGRQLGVHEKTRRRGDGHRLHPARIHAARSGRWEHLRDRSFAHHALALGGGGAPQKHEHFLRPPRLFGTLSRGVTAEDAGRYTCVFCFKGLLVLFLLEIILAFIFLSFIQLPFNEFVRI